MINHISKIALLAVLALPIMAQAQMSGRSNSNSEGKVQKKQFLGLELYVYETRLSGDVSKMAAHLPEHLEYQLELERSGVMFAAGPLFDEDGAKGPPKSGMIIVRASSMEQAREIADADPMHKAGVRTYTLRKWIINEGSLEVSLKFSGKNLELE